MLMLPASLLLSLLGVLTAWMGITVFIFPPLAAYLGWRHFRRFVTLHPNAPDGARLLALLPALVALAVFAWGFWLISTQYKP